MEAYPKAAGDGISDYFNRQGISTPVLPGSPISMGISGQGISDSLSS